MEEKGVGRKGVRERGEILLCWKERGLVGRVGRHNRGHGAQWETGILAPWPRMSRERSYDAA